jgi:hypothetical protein
LRDGRLVRVYMDAQNGHSVDDPGRQ